MDTGRLYFVKDSFYERFKGCGLLENKEIINGLPHGRPCCYMFKFDISNHEIYWMIPISSKVKKYKGEYQHSINKYNICDNISFGYILGEQRAFLPQNLFPITKNYIESTYIDKNTSAPITIPQKLMVELNRKGRKKIRYNMNGKTFGMSDVVKIYNELLKDIEKING